MSKRFTRYSRRIERNILTVYSLANDTDRLDGMLWYQNAHDIAQGLSLKHGVTLSQAVGVMAAISPGNPWGRNVIEADEFINAYQRGRELSMVGIYGRKNVNKAKRILAGDSAENRATYSHRAQGMGILQ